MMLQFEQEMRKHGLCRHNGRLSHCVTLTSSGCQHLSFTAGIFVTYKPHVATSKQLKRATDR